MDQLIPSLAVLVEGFRGCFRAEVFATFEHLLVGWIIAPGPRTISEVWQATGRAGKHHRDTAYAVFRSASWDWDDLGHVLVLMVVARLIPTGAIWLAVDDTLCHKRGAKVSFGGFFLDAVTSTKKKNFRFGLNWVVLGRAVRLPFRPGRCFCLPVVWRVYRKKGTAGHPTRTALAADPARQAAGWLPDRECWLVGDSAYLNATVLADRPPNLRVIGPLRWDAALYGRLPEWAPPGAKGRARKKGDRLPTPRQMMADTAGYPATEHDLTFGATDRRLRVQVVQDVLWYTGAGAEPVTVVLVRDIAGEWRDEALLATARDVSAACVITGYCRRWSIEVAFFESKQYLGLHDPHVRAERSVERARPMAWFVQTPTILWYATAGQSNPAVKRDRPWYTTKPSPTFTDMPGALRLALWDERLSGRSGADRDPAELHDFLKNWLAAVR